MAKTHPDFFSAAMKTVFEVPMGSRGLRITAKGPDVIGKIMHINPILTINMG